jgi:hypothetical protein
LSPVGLFVEDRTPPVIRRLTARPELLWPPNRRMVPVVLTAKVSDKGDRSPSCTIASVRSSEPVKGTGDGDIAPDWELVGPLALLLRAERSGPGSGRSYTIAVRCVDRAGNASTESTTVRVPGIRPDRR